MRREALKALFILCLTASCVSDASANPQRRSADERRGFTAACGLGPGAMTVEGFGTYEAALLMARFGWRFGRIATFVGATNARSIDGDADGYLYEGAFDLHGQYWTTERTWIEIGAGWSVTHEVRDDKERKIPGRMGLGAILSGGLMLGRVGPVSTDLRVVIQEAIHPFGRAGTVGVLVAVAWN